MPNKGNCIKLRIEEINNLGCGVGHAEDGRVVFVKGAVTGDLVEAEIIKVNKSFLVGRILNICESSEFRASEEFCSAPLSCGGCVYRHISYNHEQDIKSDYVRNAFRKVGLSDVTVRGVISPSGEKGYRNKAQYPVCLYKGRIRAGFFAAKTHNIVPAEGCSLQNPSFELIVRRVCELAEDLGWSVYDETSGKGLLRHIYLRIGERTEEIMLCLVINGEKLPSSHSFVEKISEEFPHIVGILISVNKKNTNVVLGDRFITIYGRDYIEDELCGLRFRISADSFYQVNRDGAEALYTLAADMAELKGGETVADLYCGTGTIGLSMAAKIKRLCGIEIVPSAVECARENARRNGIINAEFFCGDAGSKEMMLSACHGSSPDAVIIDPPRKGTTNELIDCLSELNVPKIVYVSCDPDTLARDCAHFRERGYDIGEVQPVDMFPRTGHVESVVCLTRQARQ